MSEQATLQLFQPAAGRRREAPRPNSFTTSDAFEFLSTLPDESVDLVITDPPYESLELHRGKGTTTRLVGDWFATVPNDKLPLLLSEVFRVLKPDRHFYLFCDEITADVIKEQQRITSAREPDGSRTCRCGLSYWRELIWAKTRRDGARIHGGMGYHYRSACERILFFEKGKRRLNDLGTPDVLMAARPASQAPAAKPESVCATFIEQSTSAGELVVDPFAGSGVVGKAAHALKREFMLNDLDASYLLPEVAAVASVAAPRFLLITPSLPEPEALLAELVEAESSGAKLRKHALHDAEMLALESARGAQLVKELVRTRSVERPAIFRRYLRTTTWAQAARASVASGRPLPKSAAAWLAWIGE